MRRLKGPPSGVRQLGRRDVTALLGALGGATIGGCAPHPPQQPSAVPFSLSLGNVSIARAGDVATLRARTGHPGDVALLEGYWEPGDGGGGVFVWSSKKAADDGGTFLTGTAGEACFGWQRLFSGPVWAAWFGAVPGAAVDTAACVNLALRSTAGQSVFVAPGVYRVDDTITISSGRHLHLTAGAVLQRPAGSRTDLPLIRLTGKNPALDGLGEVHSASATTAGIVRIGPLDNGTRENVQRARVAGITLVGDAGGTSVGVIGTSSEPSGDHGANYRATISDVSIQDVAVGIALRPLVNAYSISNVHFLNMGRYSYQFVGCSETTVVSGFTHQSPALRSVIRLESASDNMFFGVQGEPGGDRARYYEIDANSQWNQVYGHDNCPTASSDAGVDSNIVIQRHAVAGGARGRSGRGVIPPGATECVIAVPGLDDTCQVLLTPLDIDARRNASFCAIASRDQFRVAVGEASRKPWRFSWFIAG